MNIKACITIVTIAEIFIPFEKIIYLFEKVELHRRERESFFYLKCLL